MDLLGGTIILYDRKMLRNFRKDGHNWKKKKDGKTVKEAHEHLKVRHCLECMKLWLSHSSVLFANILVEILRILRILLYIFIYLFFDQ